ncbi:hypothetical protein Barb4_02161 [Bacteroidales bacterium Barb4]|nr:hypothetical protein Barb4_02161 [Bacteroidales bacterium Barb4]
MDAAGEESSETLSGGTFEFDVYRAVGESVVAVAFGDFTGEHGSYGTVGVDNGVVEGYFLLGDNGGLGVADDVKVFYAADEVDLVGCVADGVGGGLFGIMEQAGEIDKIVFGDTVGGFADDEVGAPDNVVEFLKAHFGEVFADFFGEIGEEVYEVFVASGEAFAQFLVLRGYADGAGVDVAFAHHHAAQHNEGGGSKGVFFGSQQGHKNDVATGFQLSVGLQTYLSAQVVDDEGLLCFGQSEFGRQSGVADGTHRGGSRSAFGTGDDDAVGFRFGYTGGDGSHAAFGYELDADFGGRIDVFEVEDELCQVLDGIDIVMRRRRYEGDAGDGMAGAGDDVVHFVAGQLSTFTRLRALSDFDLYFIGIHEVFGGYTETSGGYLLDGGAQGCAVFARDETGRVFATFAGVAAPFYLVHGDCHCFVGFAADRTETHGTGDEMFHDFGSRFYLIYRDRRTT